MIEDIAEIEARRAAANVAWTRVCRESGVAFSTVAAIRRNPAKAQVRTLEALSAAVTVLIQADREAMQHGS